MRFSKPRTASRLRRPISASSTATFFPCKARADPRLAVVVVLPTPPLPDVIVSILLFITITPYYSLRRTPPACPGERSVLLVLPGLYYITNCHAKCPHQREQRCRAVSYGSYLYCIHTWNP